jgi:NAD/NADP transhydrogenase beta subunit
MGYDIIGYLNTPFGQVATTVYTVLFVFTTTMAVLSKPHDAHKGRVYGIFSMTLGLFLLIISLTIVYSYTPVADINAVLVYRSAC